MKPKLLALIDKILLRKRALIETVNDQLKNVCRSNTQDTGAGSTPSFICSRG